jgi:multicomponent Na+:H+ antiporter subunit C
MTPALWYAFVGVALLGIGFHSLILTANIFRKIISLNIMGNGTFLILIALAKRVPGLTAVIPDPVPQAMVLTGVVVSVSATALALALLLRYYETTGRLVLPEDDPHRPGGRDERHER